MNFGGSTIQPTTDVVHTHRGNLENRDKKKEVKRSRFNHSEITAVNISEHILLKKNLKVRQNEYTFLYL